MSDSLSHDPRTKQQIKNALYAHLYEPVQNKLKEKLKLIILKNTVLGKYTHKSFIHKSVIYNIDETPLPRKMNRLQPQMLPEFEEYLQDLETLNTKEVPYVLGFINQVLNSSNDLHDYLRVLPESVHSTIKHLINNCPCRTKKLSEDVVKVLQETNENAIELMKQRIVRNLLI